MYNIHLVPIDKIGIVWPVVEDYVQDCLDISDGSYTKQTVLDLLLNNVWQLYIFIDDKNFVHGVFTIQPIHLPEGTSALVTIIAGRNIINKSMVVKFFKLLKELQFINIQAIVRPSMKKLLNRFGFNEQKIIVGVTL